MNVRTMYLLVAPDAFPDKSFYYGTKHWTNSQRFRARYEGRVIFDVPSQDPPVNQNAVAERVRLQGFTPREEV